MWPVLGGLISGGASLLGGMFSSSTSAANTQANIQAQEQMQGQTQQFNAEQADIQRGYETQMSNTAYQRASADMKAAGLNPAMMFGSGGAASTPSVSAPSVGTPNMALSNKTSPLAGLGDAVRNGLTSMISAKTIDKMGEEIALLNAERSKTDASTQLVKNVASGEAQKNIIRLPDETTAQNLNDFLRRHPDLVTAAEVGKYGGSAASAVTKPLSDVFSSRFGLGDLMQGFSSSAKDRLRRQYTLPEARQRMKDLEGSFQGE